MHTYYAITMPNIRMRCVVFLRSYRSQTSFVSRAEGQVGRISVAGSR